MIRLHLLSPLALERDDGTAVRSVLAQPKRFALLAYLAAEEPSASHSRDTLVALFWPELDEEHARMNLRKSLYRLRRSLGAGVLTGKGEQRVGVDPERLWCDAVAFEKALEEGRREEALELYRGPFLGGFHLSGAPGFERWMEAERRRLGRRAVEAARGLAGRSEAEGDGDGARRWLERARSLAPSDEAVLREYLELLARRGERPTAIRAYEAFARRLAEELRLEPSAETVALVERIREGGGGERRSREGPADGAAAASVPVEPPGLPRESEQEGGGELRTPAAPGRPPPSPPDRPAPWGRILGRPKVLLGGLAALVLLGLGTVGYIAVQTAGIDPAGTLIARGTLERGDTLVLADFQGPDAVLARTVTEVLRTDLERSPAFALLSRKRRRRTLERMERAAESSVTLELGRQIARREGLRAAIGGRVQPAGEGYVFTARLVAADGGEPLFSERVTAADDGGVVEAIDRLSKKVRERIGESLASVRAAPRLARYTTGSLEALKHYTRGARLHNDRGDYAGALIPLEAAIAADSTFALAYRKVSVALVNMGRDRSRALEMAEKAYRYRDRLPRGERMWVASWNHLVHGRPDSAIALYRRCIALDPTAVCAQYNNLAFLLLGKGAHAAAESVLTRRSAFLQEHGRSLDNLTFETLTQAVYPQGDEVELASLLERWTDRHPPSRYRDRTQVRLAAGRLEFEAADSLVALFRDRHGKLAGARADASRSEGQLAAARGRLAVARRSFETEWETLRTRGWNDRALEVAAQIAALEALGGDTAAALDRLEGALTEIPLKRLEPADRPYLELARIYAELGEPRTAEALLEAHRKAVDRGQVIVGARRSMPFLARGAVGLAQGRPEEALTLADSREPRGRIEPRVRLLLRGRALEALGQRAEAIETYEEFLSHRNLITDMYFLAFYRPEVLERLGRLHEETGEPEEAAGYYRRFVHLWKDADPELRPRVEEARMRLEGLTGSEAEPDA